jgi:hypothetical protein
MAEGVVHLWDALNVAQHLTACGSQFGDGDVDVVDAVPSSEALTLRPARTLPLVRCGGQYVAQLPEHALLPFLSLANA